MNGGAEALILDPYAPARLEVHHGEEVACHSTLFTIPLLA